jgi:chromosome segregation ATPase
VDIDYNITVDLKTDAVYNAVRDALDAKDARIAELQKELQKEVQAVQGHQGMIQRYEENIAYLVDVKDDYSESIERLQQEVLRLNLAFAPLQQELTASYNKLVVAQLELAKVKEELQDQHDLLESFNQYSIELENSLAFRCETYEDQLGNLQRELDYRNKVLAAYGIHIGGDRY